MGPKNGTTTTGAETAKWYTTMHDSEDEVSVIVEVRTESKTVRYTVPKAPLDLGTPEASTA